MRRESRGGAPAKATKILVAGAGPAGLAAAHELTERGFKPQVVEGRARPGGIARTEAFKGFRFDIGGHRFLTRNARVRDLWRRMLGEDFLRVPRLSRIYYRRRFYHYPLRFWNVLRNLGPLESLRIVASYLLMRLKPAGTESSFEQWVSRRFGWRLYELFFKTYTEKVWGIPGSEIGAEWAAQRIKGLSLASALSNALFGSGAVKSLVGAFDYPRLGVGMMWERFAETVRARGGSVEYGAPLVRIRHDGRRVTSVAVAGAGAAEERPVDHLISSISLGRVTSLFEPPPPQDVLDASRRLRYRALVVVVLLVDAAELFPDQWIYVHDPGFRVGRLQNFKNWSSAMVPDPNKTSIGMEYFCAEGDELWSRSDAGLAALAGEELAGLGLSREGRILDSFVIRQPEAYPVYDKDYSAALREVRQFLSKFENFQTIGRNGLHRYNNMDHAMITGILAAENIAGSGHDIWSANEDNSYLETAEERGDDESTTLHARA